MTNKKGLQTRFEFASLLVRLINFYFTVKLQEINQGHDH